MYVFAIHKHFICAEKGGSESETKSAVASIHELKEKLRRETDALKDIKRRLKELQDRQRAERDAAQGMTQVKGNAELRQAVEVSGLFCYCTML